MIQSLTLAYLCELLALDPNPPSQKGLIGKKKPSSDLPFVQAAPTLVNKIYQIGQKKKARIVTGHARFRKGIEWFSPTRDPMASGPDINPIRNMSFPFSTAQIPYPKTTGTTPGRYFSLLGE